MCTNMSFFPEKPSENKFLRSPNKIQHQNFVAITFPGKRSNGSQWIAANSASQHIILSVQKKKKNSWRWKEDNSCNRIITPNTSKILQWSASKGPSHGHHSPPAETPSKNSPQKCSSCKTALKSTELEEFWGKNGWKNPPTHELKAS